MNWIHTVGQTAIALQAREHDLRGKRDLFDLAAIFADQNQLSSHPIRRHKDHCMHAPLKSRSAAGLMEQRLHGIRRQM
jgi:hypothetical protein